MFHNWSGQRYSIQKALPITDWDSQLPCICFVDFCSCHSVDGSACAWWHWCVQLHTIWMQGETYQVLYQISPITEQIWSKYFVLRSVSAHLMVENTQKTFCSRRIHRDRYVFSTREERKRTNAIFENRGGCSISDHCGVASLSLVEYFWKTNQRNVGWTQSWKMLTKSSTQNWVLKFLMSKQEMRVIATKSFESA